MNVTETELNKLVENVATAMQKILTSGKKAGSKQDRQLIIQQAKPILELTFYH
jgi:hypothetical protein